MVAVETLRNQCGCIPAWLKSKLSTQAPLGERQSGVVLNDTQGILILQIEEECDQKRTQERMLTVQYRKGHFRNVSVGYMCIRLILTEAHLETTEST